MATILETINQVLTYENEPERQRDLLKNTFELTEEQVTALMQAIESIPEDYTQLVSVVEGLVASYGALETTVDGLSADVDDLKADLTDMDGKIAASLITNTASGAIASFPDGADGVPVEDLVVDIEPVQDLHGQANPYPGGGGKNLFNQEAYVESAFNTTYSGYRYAKILLKPNTQYTFAPKTITARASGTYCAVHVISGTDPDTMSNSDTVLYLMHDGSLAPSSSVQNTFTTGETGSIFFGFPGGSVFASHYNEFMSVDWQLETGSTPTAWTPYENICPISGWTGANVVRTGKNLLDFDAWNFSYDTMWKGGATWNDENPSGSFVLKAGTYTIASDTNLTQITVANSNGRVGNIFNASSLTFTLNKDEAVAVRLYKVDAGTSPKSLFATYNIRMCVGSTATPYEPYTGNTYSVDWTDEAGTVYGGTLDVTTGVLTVDRSGMKVGNNFTYATGNVFEYSTSAPKKPANNSIAAQIISSAFPALSQANLTTKAGIAVPATEDVIRINAPGYTTDQAFAETFSDVDIVFELATPVTYQLTPQEVTTLLGQNNVLADTGDTTVDYRANTKLYIENLTAPTEDDMTANNSIPSGTYFMIGNNLYLSTTTIPAGDTINPGTNCTRMSLASALNALNA